MNLLQAEKLTLGYARTPVVHGVNLVLPDRPGGVGLIGESGSGKTTLARALLGLIRPLGGRVTYRGTELHRLERRERLRYRGEVQPVLQEGSEALDPRMRVAASLREALRLGPATTTIGDLLADVGLASELAGRRPHELSGGQRQRVIIARALAVDPRLLILDEPTSALDVTVQARILDLLAGLRTARGLSCLLITHNLALVHRMCETTHVMFAGRVVEAGPTARLLDRPAHPYTAALRAAVPALGGPPPKAGKTAEAPAPTGCAYRMRCPLAIERCAVEPPSMRGLEDGRSAACHRAEESLR